MLPLAQSFRGCSVESGTLCGVREILDPVDLEFPILLDERDDAGSLILNCGTIGSGARHSSLRNGYMSYYEDTVAGLCRKTNVENDFSRRLNRLVDIGLGITNVNPPLRRQVNKIGHVRPFLQRRP